MSLINDALKRVKEAQRKAPPSAELGPQLRPVEPVPVPAHHGLGWLLPIALVVVALLTLLLLWELARKENSPLAVRAEIPAQHPSVQNSFQNQPAAEVTHSGDSPAQDSSAAPAATHPGGTAASNLPSGGSLTNSPISAQAKAPEPAANTNSGAILAPDASGQPATNLTSADVQPPKPPPLKLQGIVFSKRPSAVINGKTLFVGDRVREFRVAAITQDTAVLVGLGRTNVLSLSE